MAAAANQPLIVEDLLNLGAEPNATDYQGRSVLHVAATYGLPGVLTVWPLATGLRGLDGVWICFPSLGGLRRPKFNFLLLLLLGCVQLRGPGGPRSQRL